MEYFLSGYCRNIDASRRVLLETDEAGFEADWCRDEARVFLGFVASEQQQVGYAEKLQVEQFIFNVLYCRATADDVWLNRNAILVLYCCGDGNGAWAAAYALSLQETVVHLVIYKLAVVCGDVDKQRVKLL